MRTLTLQPITEAAFAPFGHLLRVPAVGLPRLDLIEDMQNLRPSARLRLSLSSIAATQLPVTIEQMERHVASSQAFLPLACEGYLVVVAPHGLEGKPDLEGLRAFSVPGDCCINYRADTWHRPFTALHGPARFAVLTFVAGAPEDDQFVPLPEPVRIVA
ncbi:MAG: ureidoglycolate hydrolase [Bradyrhizobium sp.]|nr:MAG: ureidoglycolate hydrolase [Bradyrhizobium sp.]